MAERYSVSPVKLKGRDTFTATFRSANGQRVCRSLGTTDPAFAELICAGLLRLWCANVRAISQVPPDVPLDSVRLYFGEAKFSDPSALPMDAAAVDKHLATVRMELQNYPKILRARLLPVLLDRQRLQHENESVRLEAASWKRAAETEGEKREQMERSLLNRAAQSGKNMPAHDAALKLFSEHITATTTPQNAQKHISCAKEFIARLPASIKTPADVLPDQVASFLDEKTATGDPDHALGRRREWRIRMARFLNWSAKRWGFVSPMSSIPSVPRHAVQRERGDIVWHQLDDVEKVITGLPDAYWRALVATLAYAGLQLAELVWLRTSDVELLNGKRGRIWVTTVEDPDEPQNRSFSNLDGTDLARFFLSEDMAVVISATAPNASFSLSLYKDTLKKRFAWSDSQGQIVRTGKRTLKAGTYYIKTRATALVPFTLSVMPCFNYSEATSNGTNENIVSVRDLPLYIPKFEYDGSLNDWKFCTVYGYNQDSAQRTMTLSWSADYVDADGHPKTESFSGIRLKYNVKTQLFWHAVRVGTGVRIYNILGYFDTPTNNGGSNSNGGNGANSGGNGGGSGSNSTYVPITYSGNISITSPSTTVVNGKINVSFKISNNSQSSMTNSLYADIIGYPSVGQSYVMAQQVPIKYIYSGSTNSYTISGVGYVDTEVIAFSDALVPLEGGKVGYVMVPITLKRYDEPFTDEFWVRLHQAASAAKNEVKDVGCISSVAFHFEWLEKRLSELLEHSPRRRVWLDYHSRGGELGSILEDRGFQLSANNFNKKSASMIEESVKRMTEIEGLKHLEGFQFIPQCIKEWGEARGRVLDMHDGIDC